MYEFKLAEIGVALEEVRKVVLGKLLEVDNASKDINALEDELNQFGLKDSFYWKVPHEGNDSEIYGLGVQEWGDRWRLMIDLDRKAKPLIDAPSKYRIEAHKVWLPQFLRAMAEKAKETS